MTKRLNDFVDVRPAVSISSTGGALVGIAIDGTGYSRARFVFTFNTGAAITATISGNLKVFQCATSDGTFAAITGATASQVSSGVVSDDSLNVVIDVPIDADYEWLKASGSISSTAMWHNAIVELYNPVTRPPTSSAQEVVTV